MMPSHMNLRQLLCLTGAVFTQCVAYAAPTVNYTYQPDTIYPIHAGVGIATQIELDPKDDIKDFGTGFSNGWEMVRRDNIIYLKPKDLQSDTNMYIRTNKRLYLFDLQIVSKKWKNLGAAKNEGVHYKVSFTYTDNEKTTTPNNGAPAQAERRDRNNKAAQADTVITGLRDYHMQYDYAADESAKWLIPIKVYDDSQFTYIQMPELTEFPSVFAREPDNTGEHLINSSVQKNNIIVLHGVYPYIVLRHGKDVVGLRRN